MSIAMPRIDTSKKPALQDWQPAYIVYQLRLKGLSLRRLSRLHGYAAGSAELANRLPWPKMERLIADALGVTPQQIWPSRYHDDGTSKSGRGERVVSRHKPKDITGGTRRNVDLERAV